MDFEKKFDFINRKLENLMAFHEISSFDYVRISKKLIRAEDNFGLEDVMDMMEIAVLKERNRKLEAK